MQPTTKRIALLLSLILLYSGAIAQNTYTADSTGYVNFNLGNSTQAHSEYHSIALFGCNTILNVSSKFWNGPKGFKWNKANQILSGLPFGQQIDSLTQDTFYVSKYYIASPPVFKKSPHVLSDSNTVYDIGIVTPDEFVFKGEKPVQRVYLDYNVLKPMYIKYIPVEFDSSFDGTGVDFLPFKVECKDFPWLNAHGLTNGLGASGIGALKRDSTDSTELFLPYYYVKNSTGLPGPDSTKKYLDCEVSILNDVLFHYEVSFVVNGVHRKSINLKDYNSENGSPPISLHYSPLEKLPCGCLEPKPQSMHKP